MRSRIHLKGRPSRNPMRANLIVVLSLCAGGGDLFTGLLLVFAPQMTLRMMQVPALSDPVFLQFVGCFVAAVGVTYFIGLISWFYSGRIARLRAAWELTIPFRLAAGVFVASQVMSHTLASQWWSVPMVDGAWCLVQAVLLRRGIFETSSHESPDR